MIILDIILFDISSFREPGYRCLKSGTIIILYDITAFGKPGCQWLYTKVTIILHDLTALTNPGYSTGPPGLEAKPKDQTKCPFLASQINPDKKDIEVEGMRNFLTFSDT